MALNPRAQVAYEILSVGIDLSKTMRQTGGPAVARLGEPAAAARTLHYVILLKNRRSSPSLINSYLYL